MIKSNDLKLIIEDLNRANTAMMGIGKVLEKILEDEDDAGSDNSLRGNGFIKHSLMNGIEVLSTFVDMRLGSMAELAGMEKPV